MNTLCSICYKNKTNYTTICGHDFCLGCLRRWKRYKPTCPLCRRRLVALPYPNTRSNARAKKTIKNIYILVNTISKNKNTSTSPIRLKMILELLILIWNNRIILRRNYILCDIVRQKARGWDIEYKKLKLTSPKILKKLYYY